MRVDRRDELSRQRVQTVNRLQRLLAELTLGQAKNDITARRRRRSWRGCDALETRWPSPRLACSRPNSSAAAAHGRPRRLHNHCRLHTVCHDLPPVEYEQIYYG